MRDSGLLTGWKEIEGYVGLNRKTIMKLGYPIRKYPGGKNASVVAFKDELLAFATSGKANLPDHNNLACNGGDDEQSG